jgi:tRNA (cmo5U34)-methyltransferase
VVTGEWTDAERAQRWIERRDEISGSRQEVASVVFQDVIAGRRLSRILDLGTGDGRVIAGLRLAFGQVEAVGLDLSEPMIEKARERFADDPLLRMIQHDLNEPLPGDLRPFDLVISAQAIHHVPDERKRTLYREAFELVAPGGVFCNIDLVALPTVELFQRAMRAAGIGPEDVDATDQPAPVEAQLAWLREAGFSNVDCYWKRLAGAVLAGERPGC